MSICDKNKKFYQLYNWHLEISSKCALSCSRCLRVEQPGSFRQGELGLDFIKKNFTSDFLKENVLRITFSGGFGDPIYSSQLVEIIKYLKGAYPDYQQVIVTNGSYRNREWWRELCSNLNEYDEIIFSIDGWDNTSNNLYRVNSDWNSIMVGIEEAVKSKVLVRWSTIVFKFNQDKLNEIKNIAEKKGVDSFHIVFSERFGNRFNEYLDSKTGIDPLQPDDQFLSQINRTMRKKYTFFNNPQKIEASKKIKKLIDKKFMELEARTQNHFKGSFVMPTCLFAYRGSYIDVEGYYYPCSWISHPFKSKKSRLVPSKRDDFDSSFGKYKKRINLNKNSISEVLNDDLWEELFRRWRDPMLAPVTCERKCLNNDFHLKSLKTKELC